MKKIKFKKLIAIMLQLTLSAYVQCFSKSQEPILMQYEEIKLLSDSSFSNAALRAS
ncbi:MAG: hypothetical protein ACYSTS_05155 [Planctomycetota bacterium]|jgi:hypothetical protein